MYIIIPTEQLLNYHINFVQQFTNDKEKLFKRVNSNLTIIKSHDEIKFNKSYFKATDNFVQKVFKNPIYILNILIKKIIQKILLRACSSVVERYVDIVEVISSILITPTINSNKKAIFWTIYILLLKII